MPSSNERTGGWLLLVPAILIGVSALTYVAGALLYAVFGVGIGGLGVLGMAHVGTVEAVVIVAVIGAFGTLGFVLLAAFALVQVLVGAVVLWGALQGLRGGSDRRGILMAGVLATMVCGLWTLVFAASLNPMSLLWMMGTLLAVVALVLVLAEPNVGST